MFDFSLSPLHIPFYIFIGLIVSMDVAGLTASKTAHFYAKPDGWKRWALWNGVWHAGLLALYIAVIQQVISISPHYFHALNWLFDQLLEWLPWVTVRESLAQSVTVVVDTIRIHLPVLLGLLAIAIVWQVYSSKIDGTPEEAKVDNLPPLAKATYNIVEILARLGTYFGADKKKTKLFLQTQAQAALVAVDMLALAMLLKFLDEQGTINNAVLIVLIVFVVVSLVAYLITKISVDHFRRLEKAKKGLKEKLDQLAIVASSFADTEARKKDVEKQHSKMQRQVEIVDTCMQWIRITLRFAEPFLIFYFVLELSVRLVLGPGFSGVGLLIGSFFLVIGLIVQSGFENIIGAALQKEEDSDAVTDSEFRSKKQLLSDFKELALYVVAIALGVGGIIALLVIVVWLRHESVPLTISLDEELSYLLAVFSTALTIYLWLSAAIPKWDNQPILLTNVRSFFDTCETKLSEILLLISNQSTTLICILIAFLVSTVLPIFKKISVGAEASGVSGTSYDIDVRERLTGVLAGDISHILQVIIGIGALLLFSLVLKRANDKLSSDDPTEKSVRIVLGWLLVGLTVLLAGVGMLQGLVADISG